MAVAGAVAMAALGRRREVEGPRVVPVGRANGSHGVPAGQPRLSATPVLSRSRSAGLERLAPRRCSEAAASQATAAATALRNEVVPREAQASACSSKQLDVCAMQANPVALETHNERIDTLSRTEGAQIDARRSVTFLEEQISTSRCDEAQMLSETATLLRADKGLKHWRTHLLELEESLSAKQQTGAELAEQVQWRLERVGPLEEAEAEAVRQSDAVMKVFNHAEDVVRKTRAKEEGWAAEFQADVVRRQNLEEEMMRSKIGEESLASEIQDLRSTYDHECRVWSEHVTLETHSLEAAELCGAQAESEYAAQAARVRQLQYELREEQRVAMANELNASQLAEQRDWATSELAALSGCGARTPSPSPEKSPGVCQTQPSPFATRTSVFQLPAPVPLLSCPGKMQLSSVSPVQQPPLRLRAAASVSPSRPRRQRATSPIMVPVTVSSSSNATASRSSPLRMIRVGATAGSNVSGAHASSTLRGNVAAAPLPSATPSVVAELAQRGQTPPPRRAPMRAPVRSSTPDSHLQRLSPRHYPLIQQPLGSSAFAAESSASAVGVHRQSSAGAAESLASQDAPARMGIAVAAPADRRATSASRQATATPSEAQAGSPPVPVLPAPLPFHSQGIAGGHRMVAVEVETAPRPATAPTPSDLGTAHTLLPHAPRNFPQRVAVDVEPVTYGVPTGSSYLGLTGTMFSGSVVAGAFPFRSPSRPRAATLPVSSAPVVASAADREYPLISSWRSTGAPTSVHMSAGVSPHIRSA